MVVRKYVFILVMVLLAVLLCSCAEEEQKDMDIETGEIDTYEKGYDLPVKDSVKEEAGEDCKNIMGKIRDIYVRADKGEDINAVLSDEAILQMKEALKDTGSPVIGSEQYPNMENHQEMEDFLIDSAQGNAGEVILYEIDLDGGVRRKKYIYDGMDMYVLSARGIWDDENEPMVTSFTYTRLKEWRYTEKGWFFYELCVPEPPEVSEVVDGSCAVRIRPMSDECRRMSEKYVLPLGYQGNNLLCSNWDIGDLDGLDYNGMYEYLYQMRYQDRFHPEDHPNGIPAGDFESVIMEYLPVTAEQIREWAVFNPEHQTYGWAGLGCTTYVLTFFGRSVPEVTGVVENADGTVTLTVEAVCGKGGDDAALIHELTVEPAEDGSFKYLGNKILDSGTGGIPPYQYRLK